MEPAGKVALVTGGASGIGRATALRLAAEDATVVVADIDEDGGRETVRILVEAGGRSDFVRADVAEEADARRMVTFAEERFGGLDVLVNNAGIVTGRLTFPEVEPERWMRVLDVNLRGVILGTQFGIEALRRRGGGAIVNVSSMGGIGYGPTPIPVYAASKAGINRFSAALAPLNERFNIRVNCICPDTVDTPMSQRTREEAPELWANFEQSHLMPPEQVADAILQLVRDDSLAGRVMYCLSGEPPWLVPQLDGLPWSASAERIDILTWTGLRSYFSKPEG